MDAEMTISKPQLEAAFRIWAQDHRDGKTVPTEQTLKEPLDVVARESARTLWDLLQAPTEATSAPKHPLQSGTGYMTL